MGNAAAAKREVAALQADVLEAVSSFLTAFKDEHASEAAAAAKATTKVWATRHALI